MEENCFEVIHESILQKLEEVIEIIEEKDFPSYYYDGKRFVYIDKVRIINFFVGMHENGFCIKDKITGINYSVNKRRLNENTTIQEIFIQDCNGTRYYCFLERESFTKLIECIKSEQGIDVFCRNNEIYGENIEKVIEYADEVFDAEFEDSEEIEDDDGIIVAELEDVDEDELQKLDSEFYDYGFDDDEPEEELDDESAEDLVSIEKENDENWSYEYYQIQQYLEKNNLGGMEESLKRRLLDEDKEYIEFLEQCYENYLLKINNQKIEGIKKTEIISEFEMEAESSFHISSFFREGIKLLKDLLEDKRKDKSERE